MSANPASVNPSNPAVNTVNANGTATQAPAASNPTPTANGTTVANTPGNAANTAGAVNNSTPYASASLYVGDLAADVTEALLFEIFNAVGPVASVRVCRDAATRRSLGYAYVNFHRVDDAERALDTMNFKNIRNRPCRIMWSHRDPSLRKSGLGNIFVNHLAKTIDNKQLYDTFSMFGNILSCKVAMNSKRESLGYGFVHYESDEAAANAIARVDGKVIAGEKVSVSVFKSKKERGANKNKFTNVFVKNLPPESNKDSVEELFKKYGPITSSIVQIDKESKQRAFAFVNFETPEQAQAAVDALHNQDFQTKKLFVSRAQKRDEREKELRDRFEQLKQERQKKYAGVNLYVKNLADDMDDKKLTEEFSKFGTITNAAIMMDPQTKKARGFGFVCFSTPEEATKAVTEMNGKLMDGKPLYVALAQRKDARRAQLEAQYAARSKLGGNTGVNGQGNQGPYNPAAAALMFQQRSMQGPYGPMGANPAAMYNNPAMLAAAAAAQRGGGPVWNPNQAQMMMQRGPNGMPLNQFSLMPANNRGGFPQGMNNPNNPRQSGPRNQSGQNQGGNQANGPNNRGPRQNGPQMNNPMNPNQLQQGQMKQNPMQQGQQGINPQQLAAQQQQQQQQQQGVRYTDNVRNRSNNPMQQGGQQGVNPNGSASQEQVVMPAPNEPLTIKALAAAPEEIRKQMIGERLFPLIKLQQPMLAGKITGMLLEMDNGELIHLLESQQALNEKINEALQVLEAHPTEQTHTEETEA